MPNWCNNVLLAAGEPEMVEAFRIANAQHMDIADGAGLGAPQCGQVTPSNLQALPRGNGSDLIRLVDRLGINRRAGDLSFSAVTDLDDGDRSWGTTYDVANEEVRQTALDLGAWRLLRHGLEMGRLLQWGFETAWDPPVPWLSTAASIFPDLDLVLGYSEPGSSKNGLVHLRGNSVVKSERSKGREIVVRRPLEVAVTMGRQAMPLHHKPAPLIRAIWSDDVSAVVNAIRSKGLTMGLGDGNHWTPLMHAAHAGSLNVAMALLDAGSNPLAGVDLNKGRTFGFSDVCLDLNQIQATELQMARQWLFAQALRRCPQLATTPLFSGIQPLSFAVRHQMDPLVRALQTCGRWAHQNVCGEDNGASGSLVAHFPWETIEAIGSTLDPERRTGYFSAVTQQVIAQAVQTDSTDPVKLARLFMKMSQMGLLSDHDRDRASGAAPAVRCSNGPDWYVSDAFKAILASEQARHAIDLAIGSHAKKSNSQSQGAHALP